MVWNSLILPYIGNNHPNWLTFFRRVETTKQSISGKPMISQESGSRFLVDNFITKLGLSSPSSILQNCKGLEKWEGHKARWFWPWKWWSRWRLWYFMVPPSRSYLVWSLKPRKVSYDIVTPLGKKGIVKVILPKMAFLQLASGSWIMITQKMNAFGIYQYPWLVGGLEPFFHILGISSSQLNFICFRGVGSTHHPVIYSHCNVLSWEYDIMDSYRNMLLLYVHCNPLHVHQVRSLMSALRNLQHPPREERNAERWGFSGSQERRWPLEKAALRYGREMTIQWIWAFGGM